MVLAGIAAAVLWSLPERPVIMAEQPAPPPIVPARLAAPAPPPPPAPPAPAPAAATPKEVAALYGKWSKDAASCATEYLLYQPDRSFLFDARTSLASGGTVYYDVVDDDLIAFDGSTEARYRRLGPDQIQQVSFFSTRTGPHQGGPTLVRCPDANPPDRVDWTPTSADRATAIALISEARAQFEAAEAAPGTTQTPEPLRGRWGAKCDLGTREMSKKPLARRGRKDFLGAMIRGGFLTAEERQDLTELARDGLAEHRLARRANALVLLDDGMSCEEIGRVLLLDDDTIRTWYRLYEEDGIEGLAGFNYEGRACQLSEAQQESWRPGSPRRCRGRRARSEPGSRRSSGSSTRAGLG